MTVDPGTRLGPYEIKEPLGEGGMGEVYLAEDTRLGRLAAVKLVARSSRLDPASREALLREARIASSLSHPRVCTIYDVGEAAGEPYIGMEYVEGRRLDEVIPEDGCATDEVMRMGVEIADALAHAHEKGVIHRDLKSQNVMLGADGRLKVLDFGLATHLRPRHLDEIRSSQITLDQEPQIAGTLPYMAPEVLQGEPSDRGSDIWALGVILFEATTGRRPFTGTTPFELSSSILKDPVPPLPDRVPAGLRGVIARCLEKNPARRYGRAGEVWAALESLRADPGDTLPEVPGDVSRTGLGRRRRSRLVAGIGLLVLLAAALVANIGGARDRLLGGGERSDGGAAGSQGSQVRSLAVLPLENLSGDPEQEYFVDGMTEQLTASLAGIEALRVVSRTSAMRYKGADMPLSQIAEELGVEAVIEGSVLREGSQVRVIVQLVRVDPERHLWADSYDRELRNILELHNDVAQTIASEIRVVVTPEEERLLASFREVDPEAQDAYLKGRHQFNRSTRDGLQRALQFFQRAVEIQPDYALAHAAIAEAYVVLAHLGMSSREAFPRAKDAARTALEIEPALAEGLTALADARYHYDHDWSGAEAGFRRALELKPNYATTHWWYSGLLAALGRHQEAAAEIDRARVLEPASPAVIVFAGRLRYYARDYEGAIARCREALELTPRMGRGHVWLGLSQLRLGEQDAALAILQEAESLPGSTFYPKAALAQAYAAADRTREARAVVDALEQMSDAGEIHVPLNMIAAGHVALGQDDEAIAWLERAYETRDPALLWIGVDPAFDPIRPDPRFAEILERMDLPERVRRGARTARR